MPVKPIDLQTLFIQLNQVGKQQSAEKEGAAIQGSIHGSTLKKMTDDKSKTVQTTNDDQLGQVKVKDEEKNNNKNYKRDKQKKDEDEVEEPKEEVIKDPHLGNHIDITG